MKILLRNPAPVDQNIQHGWGDFHYGLSLTHSLRELGCEVAIQYWPDWVEAEADILLVLRGLRETEEITGDFNRKVAWLYSHPEDVPDKELRLFDTILSGSSSHTEELVQRDFSAYTFLQCTDDRVFFPRTIKKPDFGNAFIFVGNCRPSGRSLVERAINARIPLKIWGKFWAETSHQSCIVDDYFPNQSLGELYRNSYCTLNDHWKDMVSYNYVNNRVFDALACGLPLLTEPNAGLDQLNLNGIKVIDQEESFDNAIDDFIVNYNHYQQGADNDAAVILENHTFVARARQFISLLE